MNNSWELCTMRFLFCLVLFTSSFAYSQPKLKLTELKNHIGDSVAVEGPVKNIAHADSTINAPTLITIGNSTNSLTIVIPGAIKNKFSIDPEEAYKNKSIHVTGRLLNNNNKMQIVISDPSQIVLVDHK